MNKVLPTEPPVITSYPRHANLISILSQHPYFEHWLFMNHIQLHCEYSGDIFYLGFYEPIARKNYPLVDLQKIRKDVIEKNDMDIILFLKNAIGENYYAYMCVDTYYLKPYPFYQRTHFTHDMFVFGYDDASATMQIADFLFEGRYYATQADYEQIRQAFHSEYDDSYGFNGIQLLKVNAQAQYPFDIDWIVLMLEDYLFGRDTSKRFVTLGDPDVAGSLYGRDIYRELIRFMQKRPNPYWVTRALHVLSDHKKLMRMRVEYLAAHRYITNTELIETSASLEKLALMIRNAFLKYAIRPDEEKLRHMTSLIQQLHDQEIEWCGQLIVELKRHAARSGQA